jgi:ABC-type transporter Mla MlaB component
VERDVDAEDTNAETEPTLDGALADELPSDASARVSSEQQTPNAHDTGDQLFATPRLADSTGVAALLGALRVTRAADGGISISAAPDTAAALLMLLRGLTELVATSSS